MRLESSSRKNADRSRHGWEGINNGGEIWGNGKNNSVNDLRKISEMIELFEVQEENLDYYINNVELMFMDVITHIKELENENNLLLPEITKTAYEEKEHYISELKVSIGNLDKVTSKAKAKCDELKTKATKLIKIGKNNIIRKNGIIQIIEISNGMINRNEKLSFIKEELNEFNAVFEIDTSVFNSEKYHEIIELTKKVKDYGARLDSVVHIMNYLDQIDNNVFCIQIKNEIIEKFKNKQPIDIDSYIEIINKELGLSNEENIKENDNSILEENSRRADAMIEAMVNGKMDTNGEMIDNIEQSENYTRSMGFTKYHLLVLISIIFSILLTVIGIIFISVM